MTKPPELPRVLGAWTATAIVIGTVIGSGVFKKPQAVAAAVPDFSLIVLVWVAGGVLAMLGALSLAEIAVRIPKAGGNYVYLREGYGRLFGFLWGWVEFWIIRSASIAALASVFTDSAHDVLKQLRGLGRDVNLVDFWTLQACTVGVILCLAAVNRRGVRWGGGLQLVVTTSKVGTLLAIPLLPMILAAIGGEPLPGRSLPDWHRLEPWWPDSFGAIAWSQVGGAMVAVLWAYHGWMNVAPIAEEIRNPSRNLPVALIVGTCTVTILYLGANLAYALVIPRGEMAQLQQTTVVAEFGSRLLGPIGAMLASAVVMLSVFGSLNGNLMVGPRLLFAMGRDALAPTWLASIHPRYQTPGRAIVVLAGWSAILVIMAAVLVQVRLPELALAGWRIDLNIPAGKPLFDVVTDFAMFGAISFETLAISTLFVFRVRTRRSGSQNLSAKPAYTCLGYPVVPMVYITVMLLVLTNMFTTQRTESLIGVGFIAVGALVYAVVYRTTKPPQPTNPDTD
ncbi:APC family permease [Tuwongella immobilis]|uniref:Amino acid permease/ SLC12A domain-containing protein n=1 Tax=Tuwongella immobilis TaxID=692036 RepID=A0A6C2YUJ1_9BACT|nr:amino acid permease [Tuwongella immobilis]VIP04585.1 amino acid transporter : Amino acid transporter OS=Singulisphaera acidiphila (strain ATCC BAA-1392 / DSM 18658 / VKM B-2454 / MOB10) GN=Sinac_6857 PE=4 SV=1: AA_permease_2 [Tuwongella immobilis]VTS06531.1 amino acid transporter : Amino acid transporter OS=Singulisphaera acidiphila (strain ATCC BAA-1392 / DSM 18658 / VKM B-2454 / MOB10) GN=Sinac_6857 PE=4 SV=1: AA_permease_2 [Tuwongella immobilis]